MSWRDRFARHLLARNVLRLGPEVMRSEFERKLIVSFTDGSEIAIVRSVWELAGGDPDEVIAARITQIGPEGVSMDVQLRSPIDKIEYRVVVS